MNQIKGTSPESVFYSGYYAEAAPFVQQLRDGGFTGVFRQRRRHQGPGVRQTGRCGRQRTPSCPARAARPPVTSPNGTPTPSARSRGTYSTGVTTWRDHAEGHRLGKITRADLLDFVRNYQGQGIARKYQWTETGELTTTLIWIYRSSSGAERRARDPMASGASRTSAVKESATG